MRRRLLILLFALAVSRPALAQVYQDTPGWFPFTFSGFDIRPTVVDLSYLNSKPAGKDGFLSAQGGVIVDGAGRRTRLFGVNIFGSSCFPDKWTATRVAARLAKMGFNVVRLLAVDNPFNAGTLVANFATGALRPDTLDLLDYFVSELKRQGIYVNLCLH